MNTKYMIGLKCKKKSKPGTEPKKFKGGSKINTIKDLIIHPWTRNPAFIFVEDDSYVECKSIILLDDSNRPIHQNDLDRQRLVHKKRGNVRVEKIGMGTKPDPYKYTIKSVEWVNNNTVILANYDGCTTFGGDKLMVLKGHHKEFLTLDPHFFEDHSIIARFPPTSEGFKLARLVAENI